MPTVSYTNIYSNDGSTVLFTSSQQYTPDGSANATVTETGVTFPSETYTYSGNKKFLGISSSANATTPTYAIGDTFILGATSSLYIVEEETKEYTLRIDGVEVTDYDNVVVNGVSYKCKKQEEISSGSFIIRDGGNQINYTFVIDDINNSGLFVDYNNVYDITNSVYIRCKGITSYVYLMPNNYSLYTVDVSNILGGNPVENGYTYYVNVYGGGSN